MCVAHEKQECKKQHVRDKQDKEYIAKIGKRKNKLKLIMKQCRQTGKTQKICQCPSMKQLISMIDD